ncbi:serine/threonine-protein kinase [Natronoglycomyces albus]|uniref:non-specific serine/threonine protein kinase n=1 Tax=Natronoglycomyces albus TaxID=2811108 RepID=A0A895XM01_9ACTN|nr:serine/threonine-protein kinase [Natronoglycomyces albus]QSB06374.1 protein kinase [Natronoglycomyces albus]
MNDIHQALSQPVSEPPHTYRLGKRHQPVAGATSSPVSGALSGPVSRTTGRSRRQRGGMRELPPVEPRDPSTAVVENPAVSENKRFCGSCAKPVGRPQAGRDGQVTGYCPYCRAQYWFTPALGPGDVLANRYQILGAIAHGGLGWIYLANDRNFQDDGTERWVVLKGLINSSDEDALESAVNERRFLVGIDHPNIVNIFDFVTEPDPRTGDPQSYIVMEYIAGQSLKALRDNYVDENGDKQPLPLSQVLTYTIEMLPAFEYLHDRNLLFCDFKPDNIIHVETWLKLIDLGAVRRIDDLDSAVYGTPGYSVPNDEVLTVGPSISSDLYTIGRSMAVMALDFKGFTGEYRESLPSPEKAPLFAEHASFHRLLLRACNSEPGMRFQSAGEMRAQVQGILGEVQSVESGQPLMAPSTMFTVEQSTFGVPDTDADSSSVGRAFDIAHALPEPMLDPSDPSAAFLNSMSATDVTGIMAELNSAPEPSLEVQLRRVTTLISAGDLHNATGALDQSLHHHGYAWQHSWLRGIICLLSGDFANAGAHFDAVYSHLPGELAPRLALAACAELIGRGDLALPYYQRIWQCDRRFVSAAYGKARLLDAMGDTPAAIETLLEVPETSNQYGVAQTAAIQISLHSRTNPPGFNDLRHMAARIASLNLEPRRHHLVSTRLLAYALTLVNQYGPQHHSGITLFDHPLTERDLRFALEKSYRRLAYTCDKKEDQIFYIDQANLHRPRTTF